MKQIGDLFDKYKTRFKPPQASVEKEFINVVEQNTFFKLKPEQVSFTLSTRTIYLTVPGILKTEILFKKQPILRELEIRLGKETCPKNIF